VKAGDVTQRVGVESIQARGVDVHQLIEKLSTVTQRDADRPGAGLGRRTTQRVPAERQSDTSRVCDPDV